jgi:hypothetical protein
VTVLVETLVLLALALEPPREPAAPPPGGFGTIEGTSTTSDVQALPPPPAEEESGPLTPYDLPASGVFEAGYGQTNVDNAEGLDHQGLSLRGHFVYYPWISKRQRVAVGLGAAYSYRGLNRWRLPSSAAMKASKAQQHQIMLSLDLLLRAHEHFSIHPAGLIGLGFYSNAKLFAANRSATIAKDEYAFVAGGSLALCSAWDILCVTGGAQLLVGVRTVAADPTILMSDRIVDPWGWHVGVGFDVVRVLERANRTPA